MPLTYLPYDCLSGLDEPLVSDKEFLWSPIYLPIYGDRFTGSKATISDFAFATFRNGQTDYITWNIMVPSGIRQVYLNCVWSPTASQNSDIVWQIHAQEWVVNDLWTAGLYVEDYQSFYSSYVINGVYKNTLPLDLSQLRTPLETIKLKLQRLGTTDGASFNARVVAFSLQYSR